MLSCCYCSKEFKYESEKKRHEQSHYSLFECDKCSKKFSFISALRRHKKQHERTGSVQCTDCGRSFRDDDLLQRHIKYAHNGTNKCFKCSASFNSDLALKSHMKTHKPNAERRFHCSYEDCKKSFNFPHHLKHHELTHTNAKQHYCKICGKGFIQFHHFKSHLKTHEPDHWLHCTVPGCGKKFVTEYARKKHLTTHKTTIDSGISSDSNCDNSQDALKDENVTCATCGQIISTALYKNHLKECTLLLQQSENSVKLSDEIEFNNNLNNIEVFSDCRKVLGKCIANENSPNSCLCAQIVEANNFYNSILTNNSFDPDPEKNEDKLTVKMNVVEENSMNNECEGCECASIRNNHQSINIKELQNTSTDCNIPKLEIRKDGIIKLEETFDLSINIENDIINRNNKYKNINDEIMNINNNIPYNSCKAVLGKCIVSGSGTISENCLCAKMAIDDQIMDQEIDEITPRPAL
ncbi:zinc finger protein 878-like [Melitaea cinxia]|uniref:zinc finger protein 878-like n=1 Tax=Melitaea cinxia TaxID=113334 RepID=UPI001E2702C2|nr:zinc finger protein 878-like [Melitaea cinxia]